MVAAAFFAGLVAARLAGTGALGVALGAAALGGAAAGWALRPDGRRGAAAVGAALAAVAGALVGARGEVAPWPWAPRPGAAAIALVVEGAPEASLDGWRTPAALAAGSGGGYPAGGRVSLESAVRPTWAPGDGVVLRGVLAPLREKANPGSPASRLPAMRADGFVARLDVGEGETDGIVRIPAELRAARAPPPGAAAGSLAGARGVVRAGARVAVERVRTAVGRLLDEGTRGEARALLRALVLGDQGAISPSVLAAFAKTGTSHLLSVSGVHVAMLAVVLLAAAALVGRPAARLGVPARAVAAALAFPGCAAYVAIAGAPLPALRTLAMLALALAALVLRRPPDAASALAAAAVGIALADPRAPGSASFDLSFAAVAGCLLLVPPMKRAAAARFPEAARRLERGPARAVGWALEGLAATAAATIATAPLVAYHVGMLPGAGVVTNLIVVPLTTAALVPVALAACVLGLAWPAAGAAVLPLPEALADTVLALVRTGAEVGGGAVVAPPGLAATVLLEGAVLAAAFAYGRDAGPRARRTLLAATAALALAGAAAAGAEALARAGAIGRPRVRITFLDVGQGDAALVELPDGARLLVDAGPDPSGRAVLGAIRARGGRLDRIVLTHGHPDHAGGLAAVRASEAGTAAPVWRNGSEAADGFARDAPRGAPPPWRHGGAVVEALWPPGGEDDEALSENDRSVVLRIRFGRRAILLCGDVEAEAEGALVAAGGLRADVVKAGHHGSRTSSTAAFVAATDPAHVVLSLGWGNRFGFPAPDVVAAWTAAGARVWRTGRDGAVVLETDGDALTLHAARE